MATQDNPCWRRAVHMLSVCPGGSPASRVRQTGGRPEGETFSTRLSAWLRAAEECRAMAMACMARAGVEKAPICMTALPEAPVVRQTMPGPARAVLLTLR